MTLVRQRPSLAASAQFAPTSLTLTATTYATNNAQPQLFIARSPTGLRMTWPLGFASWVLQSSTNLASPFWSPVAVACDNQAVVPIVGSQQYFRLKQ